MKEAAQPIRSPLAPAAALFHSLSDPTRLEIMRRLGHGEARVTDLVQELGLAQSTVSAHVSCLRDCGLISGRHEARQIFYSIASEHLTGLFISAEAVLEETGERVALCDHSKGSRPKDEDRP